MSALGTWTEDDIQYTAKTCSELARKIVLLCSERKTFGYSGLAQKAGVTYAEAHKVGQFLQCANLAEIKLLKPGYAGSGIFLNDNGERLRRAVVARHQRGPSNTKSPPVETKDAS